MIWTFQRKFSAMNKEGFSPELFGFGKKYDCLHWIHLPIGILRRYGPKQSLHPCDHSFDYINIKGKLFFRSIPTFLLLKYLVRSAPSKYDTGHFGFDQSLIRL